MPRGVLDLSSVPALHAVAVRVSTVTYEMFLFS